MIGRFLELSLRAPDILESIAFWERLGFRQVRTNDVWNHPYAVLSDGHVILGLHAHRVEEPALTFVRPDLARHLDALRALGIEFEFVKTAEDQFHEAAFLSPEGQMVTLLESRTCNTPAFEDEAFSLAGRFEELAIPVRRIDQSLPFWARLGLAVVEFDEGRPDTALLVSGSLRLRLSEERGLRAPTLRFSTDDPEAVAAKISEQMKKPARDRAGFVSLTSPEGLAISISARGT